MNQERAIVIIRLARTLGRFDLIVNEWPEYLARNDDGTTPKENRETVDRAILRCRAFTRALGDAAGVALNVLTGRRRHRVLMQINLAHASLGQADIPAELALIEKFHVVGMNILINAGVRLKKICKRRFALLEADMLAWYRVQSLGDEQGEKPPRKCRLEIVQNESGDFAMLDGEPHDIGERAAEFLAAAIQANGDWVSAADSNARSRDITAMPKPIRELVEASTGKGTRLKQSAWLS